MNAKKFIKIYEREIKEYRDEYYRNIILNNNKTSNTYPVLTFLIPLVISALILVLSEFTILSYIISIITLIFPLLQTISWM